MGRKNEAETRVSTLSKEFVSDSSDEEVEGSYTNPSRAKKASAVHEQEHDHSGNSDIGEPSEIVTAATTSDDGSSSENGNANEATSRSEKQIKPRIRAKAPPIRPQKSA